MKKFVLAALLLLFPLAAGAVDTKYGPAGDKYEVVKGTLLCDSAAGVVQASHGSEGAYQQAVDGRQTALDWFSEKGCVVAGSPPAQVVGFSLVRILPYDPDEQDVWRVKVAGQAIWYVMADRFQHGPRPTADNPHSKER